MSFCPLNDDEKAWGSLDDISTTGVPRPVELGGGKVVPD